MIAIKKMLNLQLNLSIEFHSEFFCRIPSVLRLSDREKNQIEHELKNGNVINNEYFFIFLSKVIELLIEHQAPDYEKRSSWLLRVTNTLILNAEINSHFPDD